MNLPRWVGAVRLSPLAGSPEAQEHYPADSLQSAGLLAVREAQVFAQAGFDGVLLSNTGDAPFYPESVPPETVASIAIIAAAVREAVRIQVGIRVLRNDARAALAIAAVTGCDFIRVQLISQIECDFAFLARERARLNSSVAILADVPIHENPYLLRKAAVDSGVNGIILTGLDSEKSIDTRGLQVVSRLAKEGKIPLYLSCGASHDKLTELRPWIERMIVGSGVRKGGSVGSALDPKRVREFAHQFVKASRGKKVRMTKEKVDQK